MAVETSSAFYEKTDEQKAITEMVRQFVDEQIIPQAEHFDHVEELSRGWISISGVVNTHFIGSYLLMKFGTDEQKEYFLPKMATGQIRAAFSLSEPEVGSDVQGIKASAKKTDDGNYEINGQKM